LEGMNALSLLGNASNSNTRDSTTETSSSNSIANTGGPVGKVSPGGRNGLTAAGPVA
jgi:hypothetical protein